MKKIYYLMSFLVCSMIIQSIYAEHQGSFFEESVEVIQKRKNFFSGLDVENATEEKLCIILEDLSLENYYTFFKSDSDTKEFLLALKKQNKPRVVNTLLTRDAYGVRLFMERNINPSYIGKALDFDTHFELMLWLWDCITSEELRHEIIKYTGFNYRGECGSSFLTCLIRFIDVCDKDYSKCIEKFIPYISYENFNSNTDCDGKAFLCCLKMRNKDRSNILLQAFAQLLINHDIISSAEFYYELLFLDPSLKVYNLLSLMVKKELENECKKKIQEGVQKAFGEGSPKGRNIHIAIFKQLVPFLDQASATYILTCSMSHVLNDHNADEIIRLLLPYVSVESVCNDHIEKIIQERYTSAVRALRSYQRKYNHFGMEIHITYLQKRVETLKLVVSLLEDKKGGLCI